MIKLLLEPVNLLILDEPTNHLDMQSKDVLKEAIKAFDGTAIIVSHDREFLDGLVDKVYEFAGGKVREHLGGIYDYLRAHNAESISQALANQVGMASAGCSIGPALRLLHLIILCSILPKHPPASSAMPSTRNSRRRFARLRRL